MTCIPEDNAHTEECIKGTNPCAGSGMSLLRTLVYRRDKRYIGDLSDPTQMAMYKNNITNLAVDAEEQRMKAEGVL